MTHAGDSVDDRFQVFANWGTLRAVARQAGYLHRGHWHIEDAIGLRGDTRLIFQPSHPTVWGGTVGRFRADGWRWCIAVNDRLTGAARTATIGHELGHTWQAERIAEGVTAPCEPLRGLSPIEQEAHALGAIWTVPLADLPDRRLEGRDVFRIMERYRVPSSYVYIRDSLAVLMDEKRGDRESALADLNWVMIAHQHWMARVAELMSAAGRG